MRVWTATGHLLAELPAAFVLELLRHYLVGIRLQTRLAEVVGPPRDKPMLPSLPRNEPRLPHLRHADGRRLRGRLGEANHGHRD